MAGRLASCGLERPCSTGHGLEGVHVLDLPHARRSHSGPVRACSSSSAGKAAPGSVRTRRSYSFNPLRVVTLSTVGAMRSTHPLMKVAMLTRSTEPKRSANLPAG